MGVWCSRRSWSRLRGMRPIPAELLSGPFRRSRAVALGVSPRILEGTRFVRIHPRVYRHRDHPMTFADRVAAAQLALSPEAPTTGITRIPQLGLGFGPTTPLRFVTQGDLHLDLDGIFLHRTVALPPLDDVGVTPAAAFLAYCSLARTIDAIQVGDWLLRHRHCSSGDLRVLAHGQEWRAGAREALLVIERLLPGSRSLKESELRAILEFAGLPAPEPNGPIELGPTDVVHGDLWFARWRTAVEYEGGQHQQDRGQYVADIDRYARYRHHNIHYVQITKERLRSPRAVVREVHRALVAGGYDAPPPLFGDQWDALFTSLSRLVRRRPTGDDRSASHLLHP